MANLYDRPAESGDARSADPLVFSPNGYDREQTAHAYADLQQAIRILDAAVKEPSAGLPEEVYRFVTRMVPMVNVDLLIRDEWGRLLLTWREDEVYGNGWHFPGGIIRYQETAATRVQLTAKYELAASVAFELVPTNIEEMITPNAQLRGHFVSLAYNCTLTAPPDETLRYQSGIPRPGEWKWFRHCPENLIPVHNCYRRFFAA